MRLLVFVIVCLLMDRWPIFGGESGTWASLFQGVMVGAIVCTAATPSGWEAIRRIGRRLRGSQPHTPTTKGPTP